MCTSEESNDLAARTAPPSGNFVFGVRASTNFRCGAWSVGVRPREKLLGRQISPGL